MIRRRTASLCSAVTFGKGLAFGESGEVLGRDHRLVEQAFERHLIPHERHVGQEHLAVPIEGDELLGQEEHTPVEGFSVTPDSRTSRRRRRSARQNAYRQHLHRGGRAVGQRGLV